MVFDPHSFRKNIAGIKTQVPTISGKKVAYYNAPACQDTILELLR